MPRCLGIDHPFLASPRLEQVVTADAPDPGSGKKKKKKKTKSGQDKGKGAFKFRAREEGDASPSDVALHPSCIASQGASKGDLGGNGAVRHCVYLERVKTTRVYVRDVTPVCSTALLLFGGRALIADAPPSQPRLALAAPQHPKGGNRRGGKLQQQAPHQQPPAPSTSVVRLDGWLAFRVPGKDRAALTGLRSALDAALRRKVEHPHTSLGEGAKDLLAAVVGLLDAAEWQGEQHQHQDNQGYTSGGQAYSNGAW
jgi:hypothetical protein